MPPPPHNWQFKKSQCQIGFIVFKWYIIFLKILGEKMLGVLYLSVNSKHYLMTIYKCVGKAEYIYQMDETYLKVFLIFISF